MSRLIKMNHYNKCNTMHKELMLCDPLSLTLELDKDKLYVPLIACIKYLKVKPPPIPTVYPVKVTNKPLERQVHVLAKIIEDLSNPDKLGTIIECDVGFGKTYMSLYVALKTNMPTIIICPLSKLVTQWYMQLSEMCPNAVKYTCAYSTVKDSPPTSDTKILIIRADLVGRVGGDILKSFNLLIIDEIHTTVNKTCINAILQCNGIHRLIGCTATLNNETRKLYTYLTNNTDTIKAKMIRPFTAVFINLGVTCDEKQYLIERNKCRGGNRNPAALVEYGKIERLLGNCKQVLLRIADFVVTNSVGRKVIIICKNLDKCFSLGRIIEKYYTHELPKNAQSAVTYLTGPTGPKYDGHAPILVGTFKKLVVGFDQGTSGIAYDKRYDTLCVCDSMAKYDNIWQALGRVLRSTDTKPRLYWFYHPMKIFEKHVTEAKNNLSKEPQSKLIYMDPYEDYEIKNNALTYEYKGKPYECGFMTYEEFIEAFTDEYGKANLRKLKKDLTKYERITCKCKTDKAKCIAQHFKSI